jgi:hypothetical protein
VSEKEALHYLKLREINEVSAAQIYELVGGHTIYLKFIADTIIKSKGNVTLQGTWIVCYM